MGCRKFAVSIFHRQQGYDSYDTVRLELVLSKFTAGDDNLIEEMNDSVSEKVEVAASLSPRLRTICFLKYHS